MICYWYSAPSYFFFAPDLPTLLYYSHIPATVLALLVGLFVFINARHLLLNKLLLLIAISFSLLTLINLITWTNINSDLILFVWTFFSVLFGFISILSIYFIYVFLNKKDVTFRVKLVFLALLLPVLLFAATDISISGFNLALCDAFEFEGFAFKSYYTLLGILAMIWILILLIHKYQTATKEFKKQIVLMGIGIELFLFSLFTIFFLATYLTGLGWFDDSRLEFYSFFGMTIFMIFIGILIVKFKTFNVGAVAANVLVIALLILIGSQFTYITSTTNIVLTTVTLILTAAVGFVLIRSVRKEIEQRKEIEGLAKKLQRANKRLKVLDKMKSEFVSIASHQLRSPLTSIRGYASMLLEGSFGKLTPKATDAVARIADSSATMATSIEDYLSVSRIEAGNMKYEKSDFNLKDEASNVVDDKRREALKAGLVLTFKSDLMKKGIVNADVGKTRQILHNLVNNSIKYTPKGNVRVFVHDNPKKKKIYVDIIDTGIGMSPETIEEMFDKFERASNANHVNVTGTGLGLYIARKMATEMGGDVTATSEGEGKGSTFTLELPLQM